MKVKNLQDATIKEIIEDCGLNLENFLQAVAKECPSINNAELDDVLVFGKMMIALGAVWQEKYEKERIN